MHMKSPIALILCFILFEPKNTELPAANKKVIEFVEASIGKKIDRGECWDLANRALQYAGAKWQFPTNFGKPVNYHTTQLLPGDIVQFNYATFEHKTDTSLMRWRITTHTAIIYKFIHHINVLLAEQNVNNNKHVKINPIDFAWLKSGKIFVYRPQL